MPLRWTVETSRATPAQFEAYQGETLDLEASLQSYGKPVEMTGIAALYWQTNGMGSTYWEASAAVNSNRLSAVWTPEMDVGAKVYNCFIGQPGTIYHAAFQLRLRPSPGATPNVLPLPTPVIDFAKVRVLNPPWEGGGGGGVNTNAVIDIIHKTVDGAARPLPPYLHALDFDDSYPEAAAEYYEYRRTAAALSGSCSAVRSGNFLSRNFDYPFDERAEFVVKMSAGKGRFASVCVANVGTNLTEKMVTSGKWSKWYKALPGATVDGINENGVVAEINVVDGDPQTSGWHTTGDLHPLAAVRWALDHATNAQHAAEHLAANIHFPAGWQQNFHYMIADEGETWVVENGFAAIFASGHGTPVPVMTNFRVIYTDTDTHESEYNPLLTVREYYGSPELANGVERFALLSGSTTITNVWYTNAYRRETNPPWVSDLRDVLAYTNDIFNAWATHPKEYFRNKTNGGEPWWQTVHTSVYDITNRVLRIAVQETDDWYVFALAKNGTDEAKVRELAGEVVAPVASSVATLSSSVSGLQSSKLNKSDVIDPASATTTGKAADALKVKEALAGKLDTSGGTIDGGDLLVKTSGSDFRGIGVEYGGGSNIGKLVFDQGDWYLSFKNGVDTIWIRIPQLAGTIALLSDIPAPYTPPSYLRVYDEVRQCWWRGRMVNGVINWEVE